MICLVSFIKMEFVLLKQLWSSGVIGTHTPFGLQNAVFCFQYSLSEVYVYLFYLNLIFLSIHQHCCQLLVYIPMYRPDCGLQPNHKQAP